MLTMRMLSVSPGMPGRMQQMPRTTMSVRTPAREASRSFSMMSMSVSEFILNLMRPRGPLAISSSIRRSMVRLRE